MSNYGDQIYPGVFDALLRRLGIEPPRSHHGLIEGTLPDGRPVGAITDFRADGLDAVLIGGGDIVRVDRRVVAMDHLCVPTSERSRFVARARARWFARRAIGDRPGPWIARSWGAPAAYVSAGVHSLPSSPQMAEAIGALDAAWVRTERGVEILTRAGMPADAVLLGPDAVFALPLVESADSAAERGSRILTHAIGSGDPVVVFHAAPFTGWDAERMARLLVACSDVPRVVLPLGGYAGEHLVLQEAAQRAGVPYLGTLEADEVTGVLAAAGCVVSTSMHAAIVAATYGRPTVAPGVKKTATAFEACPEPPPLHQADDAQIPELVGELRSKPRMGHSEANVEAVVTTLDRVTTLLGLR